MATKSDFAQKLLNDLRQRKEKMGATQNSSRQSGHTSRDTSGNPGRTNRGAQQINPLVSAGSRAGNPSRSSDKGSRSINFPESSNQIVIYETGQNSRQVRDLAMAIAFAFENREKLTKMGTSSTNPLVNFFNRFGRRSMDCRKMDITSSDNHSLLTSQFPAVSQIHISEISKGVQKLNQILRDCSNGVNFDRNSIEVGKELLKGSIDLEESLRMLVNLQGASAYKNGTQQQSRIKLLDEDEDDKEDTIKTADNWQLSRPRFSFDNTSKGSRVARGANRYNSSGQQLALSYLDETSKQAVSNTNIVSHKRSATFESTPSMQVKQSNKSSSSQPTQEKGRISNVIAKLMGLQEVPLTEDTIRKQQDSNEKEGTQRKVSSKANKLTEPLTRDSRNGSVLSTDKKLLQTKVTPVNRDTKLINKAEKNQETPDGSSKMVKSEGNKIRKDVKVLAVGTDEASANTMMHKQQARVTELNQVDELQSKQDNKRKLSIKENREGNIMEARERNKSILNVEIPHKATNGKISKVEVVERNGTQYDLTADSSERHIADKDLPSNRQKPQDHQVPLQVSVPKKPENSEDNQRVAKKGQQFQKQNFLTKKKENHKLESRISSKPKKFATTNMQKRIPRDKSTSGNRETETLTEKVRRKDPPQREQDEDPRTKYNAADQEQLKEEENVQNPSPRDPQFDKEKEKPTIVYVSQKKAIPHKVEKTENRRKIDELIKRRTANVDHLTRSVKQPANMLQDLKQQVHRKNCSSKETEQQSESKVEEEESDTIMLNASEMKVGTPKQSEKLQNEAETPKQSEKLQNEAETQKQSDKLQNEAETPKQSEMLQNEAEQVIRLNSHDDDVFQTQNRLNMPTVNNCCDDTSNSKKVSDNLQTVDNPSKDEQELKQCDPSRGEPEGGTTLYNPPRHDNKQFPLSVRLEQLTEPEKDLKEIVIKSQLFLNTAEALFKLNIPISFLHDSDHTIEVANNKLILDCGYEVMKRKARRHEATLLHPYSGTTTLSHNLKVRSLDDLVKQLCRDFETLKSYGGEGSDECDVAERLHKMLENDMYNKGPHVNSVWDSEWDRLMHVFSEKEELVRDVEKHMLNGLLDEIANDLVPVYV